MTVLTTAPNRRPLPLLGRPAGPPALTVRPSRRPAGVFWVVGSAAFPFRLVSSSPWSRACPVAPVLRCPRLSPAFAPLSPLSLDADVGAEGLEPMALGAFDRPLCWKPGGQPGGWKVHPTTIFGESVLSSSDLSGVSPEVASLEHSAVAPGALPLS